MFNAGAVIGDVLRNSSVHVLIMTTFVVHLMTTTLPCCHLRLLIYLYGLMDCKLLLHLMIAHVTGQRFEPFRLSILLSCALLLVNQLVPASVQLSEALLVWALLIVNLVGMVSKQWIVFTQLIMTVASEMKVILGIEVFRVKPMVREITPYESVQIPNQP